MTYLSVWALVLCAGSALTSEYRRQSRPEPSLTCTAMCAPAVNPGNGDSSNGAKVISRMSGVSKRVSTTCSDRDSVSVNIMHPALSVLSRGVLADVDSLRPILGSHSGFEYPQLASPHPALSN